MIKRNEIRTGDLHVFLSVIEEQFKFYNEFENKNLNLEQMNGEEIVRLQNNKIHSCYIVTIFTAMFLEAYIYDHIARKRTDSFAKSLEKLDPCNKWKIGTALCHTPGIDSSRRSFENLKKLFKIRNDLTHNKSKIFNWDRDKNWFGVNPEEKVFNPKKCLGIILDLLNDLHSIDTEDQFSKTIIDRLNNLKSQYSEGF